MRLVFQIFATSVLLASAGCSDDAQPSGPGGSVGGSAGAGLGGAGVAGLASGGASAGSSSGGTVAQAGSVGAGSSAGGSAGVGGGGAGGAGGMFSDDPGTRAFQMHCLMCHGEQGVGIALGPEIQHPVRDFSTWVVRNGLPGVGYLKPMEAIPQGMLSDADLNLIFDYLDKPPQPTTAEGLYKDYCGNCHGADGKGGPTTRDITGDAVDPIEEVVRQGTHLGMYEERNEYMPAYPTSRVSDAELQLISDYVDTL